MQLALYLGVLVYMYLSTSVAAQIGIEQVGTTSSFIIVLLALHAFKAYDINKLVPKFKAEYFIILMAVIIIVLKYIMNDLDAMKGAIFFLIVPAFLSILLGVQGVVARENIKRIVLFFFITECLLALYERAVIVNVFPYEEMAEVLSIENFGFRSSAFLGHPLANALCVSTIMGFVLISYMKLTYRMMFVVAGYVSLLCFNARGAILVWTILLAIFLVKLAISKKKEGAFSLPMLALYGVSAFALFQLVIVQGFGDRFFQGDLIDGSALARVQVFDAFDYISGVDFWFGNSASYMSVMYKLGAGGVENSFIVIILNYGIVMALILFVAYFLLVKRLIKPFELNSKIIIIASFIVVGSMNNSLASSTSWAFFILCAIAFAPIEQSQNNKQQSNGQVREYGWNSRNRVLIKLSKPIVK